MPFNYAVLPLALLLFHCVQCASDKRVVRLLPALPIKAELVTQGLSAYAFRPPLPPDVLATHVACIRDVVEKIAPTIFSKQTGRARPSTNRNLSFSNRTA